MPAITFATHIEMSKGGVMTTEATVGQKVICNGHKGTVTKVCDGQLSGMVEVRLERGSVCVPYVYPDCYPVETINAQNWWK